MASEPTTTADATGQSSLEIDSSIEIFKHTFGCYFNEGTFSDAVIKAGEHIFKVHKLVLCAHSPVFRTGFVGEWKEAKENCMTIDEPPAIVEAMLFFLYNFHYDSGYLMDKRGTPMLFHNHMYAIGEAYAIATLKDYAKEKFKIALVDGWNTDEFAPTITAVYTSTPEHDRGLRDILVKKVVEKMQFIAKEEFFKKALRDHHNFAVDMAETLARLGIEFEALSRGRWYKFLRGRKSHRKGVAAKRNTFVVLLADDFTELETALRYDCDDCGSGHFLDHFSQCKKDEITPISKKAYIMPDEQSWS